ncbi:hypothetical protein MSPP1_000134 [Malassezia sp. CBS 17886]|nr:hypothetical protein MSPP1_000134 [Malassezia sp. CBS 17886]
MVSRAHGRAPPGAPRADDGAARPSPRWGTAVCTRQALMVQTARLCEPRGTPDGVYLAPDERDPLRASMHVHAHATGFLGVLFVRTGDYAPGVFRFSVQFSTEGGALVLPTVHFPPILLHPLVEPASGRLNMLAYVSQEGVSDAMLDPLDADFLSHVLHFLVACFEPSFLHAMRREWSLNDHAFDLFHLDAEQFASLARQSAHLSTTPSSLFDVQAGSGVPGDVDVARSFHGSLLHGPHPVPAVQFKEMSDGDMAQVRDALLAPVRSARKAHALEDRVDGAEEERARDTDDETESREDEEMGRDEECLTDDEDFDQEPALDAATEEVGDGLVPPTLRLHVDQAEGRRAQPEPKTTVAQHAALRSSAALSEELQEKRKTAFRTLWMQALTEGFGDELDALRSNDVRLQEDKRPSSSASARLPLLINALGFGGAMLTDAEAADDLELALPSRP